MGDFTEKNRGLDQPENVGIQAIEKLWKKLDLWPFEAVWPEKNQSANQTMLSAATRPRPWKCGWAKIWQSPTVQMGTSGLYHRKMVEFWAEKKLGFASKYWQKSVIFSLYGWGCDLKQEQAVTLRTSMVNHVTFSVELLNSPHHAETWKKQSICWIHVSKKNKSVGK